MLHRHELGQPGHEHEDAGVALLQEHGFSAEQARYARTHDQWRDDPAPTLEALLVALADTIWKGKRDALLEEAILRRVARYRADAAWALYATLDEMIEAITQDAGARLIWHGKHPR